MKIFAAVVKESTDDEGEPSIYIHGQYIEREEI